MAKPKVPEWLDEPKPVKIRCSLVRPGSHPGEMIVQFKANGEEFTAFVPESAVDPDERALRATIIAKVEDGYLVDLPTETLTSGPRIRVPHGEWERLIFQEA